MGNLALLVASVIRMGKAVSIPVIKAYACKQCYSVASVSIQNNQVKVQKCRCV